MPQDIYDPSVAPSHRLSQTNIAFPTDRAASQARDELVVFQQLEEIHQLVQPSPSGVAPSALRLQAAAKLYLDTRNTFEAIERNVEAHMQSDRPKFLRKLSKRNGLGLGTTPRTSLILTAENPTSCPSTARLQVEAAAMARTLSGPVSPVLSLDHARRSFAPRPTEPMEPTEPNGPPLNDALIDRIQDLFRQLGETLSRAILDELRHRDLSMHSLLHYVRFLPPAAQWAGYMEKRDEETRQAYHPPHNFANEPTIQQLKRNAEFIKEQIRKDVNTVCIFAPDGTLSTIFGDDISTESEAVAEKFELLIREVYARYVLSIIDTKMDELTKVSDQWQQDMAVMGLSSLATAEAPHAQLYMRTRKFRSKITIFPRILTAIDDRSALLPASGPGQQARILVADSNLVGIWWQKAILAATDRDITTVHTDENRAISGVNASLDGQIFVPLLYENPPEFIKRYANKNGGGLAKWQGHRLLVNTGNAGKDSLWVEVVVLEVDDKRIKLQLKKSIENATETSSWKQLLASANEWLPIKELKFCMVPLNPNFRIQMGIKFRTMVDVFQSLVTEIGSIFPNEELEKRAAKSIWQSVETSISRGEHIYARYFRSILNLEWQPRRPTLQLYSAAERASSIVAASTSMRNLVAALEHSALAYAGGGAGAVSGSSPAASPAAGAGVSQGDAHGSVGRGSNSGRASGVRRLSLSTSTSQRVVNRAVETAFFDDKGAYHHQVVHTAAASSSHPMAMRATQNQPMLIVLPAAAKLSQFEKLCHHLLEECEMVGACIQNNNISLARAFAQVLQEKMTKMTKQIQSQLDKNEANGNLETVICEYAQAARFLYTWRIVRHELVAAVGQQKRTTKQRDEDKANVIHSEWVTRSFHKMEALASLMLQLQLQFVQRVFFHQSASFVFGGVSEQDWKSSKPWFGNGKVTYAIQFLVWKLDTLLEDTVLRQLIQYEHVLGVHEKMHELSAWLVMDTLANVAALYEQLVVSRAREKQWKMDVLYLVVGVHRLLAHLDQILHANNPLHHVRQDRRVRGDRGGDGGGDRGGGGGGARRLTTAIREICLKLLTQVALRCGPAAIVATEVLARVESESEQHNRVDAVTELQAHMTALLASTGLGQRQGSSTIHLDEDLSIWSRHNVFGDFELKKLADVELNWASLIARSCLCHDEMVRNLQQRHELGEWVYPPLTDDQVKARNILQACVSRVQEKTQPRGSESPPPSASSAAPPQDEPNATNVEAAGALSPSSPGHSPRPSSRPPLLANGPTGAGSNGNGNGESATRSLDSHPRLLPNNPSRELIPLTTTTATTSKGVVSPSPLASLLPASGETYPVPAVNSESVVSGASPPGVLLIK